MSYIPAADSLKVLNSSGTTINPATDESVQLLRRMVKILDSLATVDSQNRQRVTLDAANVGLVVSQATAASLNANIGTIGSIDPRYQFVDAARIAYATGVRTNLKFT